MAAVTRPMTHAVISAGHPPICPLLSVSPSLRLPPPPTLLRFINRRKLFLRSLPFLHPSFLLSSSSFCWQSGFSGLMNQGGLRAASTGLIRILIKERTRPDSLRPSVPLLLLPSISHPSSSSFDAALSRRVAFLITAAHHKRETHYTYQCERVCVCVFASTDLL